MNRREKLELAACYRLIRESLQAKLNVLHHGGVSIYDQAQFWDALDKVECFCDLVDYCEDAPQAKLDYDRINQKIDWLEGDIKTKALGG